MKKLAAFVIFAFFISGVSSGIGFASSKKTDPEEISAETLRSELLREDQKSRVSQGRGPANTSQNVLARKKYPGGADEDDLQVQPALPIPTRTYDGSVVGDEAAAE